MAKLKRKREMQPQSLKCPICDLKDVVRDHIARHFSEELNQYVLAAMPDPNKCNLCSFVSEGNRSIAIHVALVHGKLDELLRSPELVKTKRANHFSNAQQTKKQNPSVRCPICDASLTKAQYREHVLWHFIEELRQYVSEFEDPDNQCQGCEFKPDNRDHLVKHVAFDHQKLEELLQCKELIEDKRSRIKAKPKKNPKTCPICDLKDAAREHIARHFGEELLAVVANNPVPNECTECEYKADKPKTLSIHVGLVHGRLDQCLMNQELVEQKREEFMNKPKKVAIGNSCPICDIKFAKSQNRDHVAWHYVDELRLIVSEFPDSNQCPQCPYTSSGNDKNMLKHVALGHSMLDALLKDEALLEQKRANCKNKPKKVSTSAIPNCPICDVENPQRDHIARHFGDELTDIVMEFADPNQCTQCQYKSDKHKNVAIHVALAHHVLDRFLLDKELVATKREAFMSKPAKISFDKCPVCDIQFTKGGQGRDHVLWHFMDELRDYVNTFPDKLMCTECTYTTDKTDNLVKHVALGHNKLDKLLQDENLIVQKRETSKTRTKKVNIGPQCPICDLKFAKAPNRDHVASHFTEELKFYVEAISTASTACQLCNYTTPNQPNLLKHYALGHSKLDEYLQDQELCQRKREEHQKKPKKMSYGPDCPICGAKGRDRDHIARHFLDELLALLKPKQKNCEHCEYKSSKQEYLAKHMALVHCKLDEFMANEELVNEKRSKAQSKPKRANMGDSCIICNLPAPTREHVATKHYLEELLEMANKFEDPTVCEFEGCDYTTEKPEYTARHLALVHCKLEELLQNGDLILEKAKEYGHVPTSTDAFKATNQQTPSQDSGLRKSSRNRTVVNRGDVVSSQTASLKCERDTTPVKRKTVHSSLMEEASTSQTAKISPSTLDDIKKDFTTPKDEECTPIMIKEEDVVFTDYQDEEDTIESKVESSEELIITPETSNMYDEVEEDVEEQEIEEDEDSSGPMPSLPPSISLTPTLAKMPKMASISTLLKRESTNPSLDPKTIAEVNNSWADSLMPKRPRSGSQNSNSSSDVKLPGSVSLTPSFNKTPGFGSVTLTPKASPAVAKQPPKTAAGYTTLTPATGTKRKMEESGSTGVVKIKRATKAKWQAPSSSSTAPTATITPVATQEAAEPGTSLLKKKAEENPKIRDWTEMMKSKIQNMVSAVSKQHKDDSYDDYEDDEMDGMLVPQVIMDDHEEVENKENSHEEKFEFCDVCDMELINHPDEEACPPHEGYVKAYPQCPVCEKSQPTREHVALHFLDELLEVVSQFPTPLTCTRCEDYATETEKTLALHVALVHEQIQPYLDDFDLVQAKAAKFVVKPPVFSSQLLNQVFSGKSCPVCDQLFTSHSPENSHDHVVWHFIEELRELIQATATHSAASGFHCTDCDDFADKQIDGLGKHLALDHSKLETLLEDEDLMAEKRKKFMSSKHPQLKTHIGNNCPVCDLKDPSREHVSRHFMPELLEHVNTLPDKLNCKQCNNYRGEKPQNLAKHVALVHSMLDACLRDSGLVDRRRKEFQAKPKKISIGDVCPVCKQSISKRDSRVHVIWHYMDDLRELVMEFSNTSQCEFCPYTNHKIEKMAKHIALGHSKLDELLSDQDLLEKKQQIAANKPKKAQLGPQCPICDVPFTKNTTRDHVAWHFMEELRQYVQNFDNVTQCPICPYQSDKLDGMAKHMGLGHSKVDELLQNAPLVELKRQEVKSKRKFAHGSPCPICDAPSATKDHVLHQHFMEEFRTVIQSEYEDETRCNLCEYQSTKGLDGLVIHLALGHSKLDEMLTNEQLVAEKRLHV